MELVEDEVGRVRAYEGESNQSLVLGFEYMNLGDGTVIELTLSCRTRWSRGWLLIRAARHQQCD